MRSFFVAASAALLLVLGQGQEQPVQQLPPAQKQSPISKVTSLLTQMQAQVQQEGEEDLEAVDAYKCWCDTNEKEKTAAIENAETRIEELTAFLEEAGAKEGQIKTEIAGLEDDIAKDKDALASAAGLREQEHEEFATAEADMKETIEGLTGAVAILSKVQLLQKTNPEAAAALLQVRNVLKRIHAPQFRGAMQRDLFELLGSLQEVQQRGHKSLRRASAAALDQLPWDKSDEQAGIEAKPNELSGGAAGAKSYNSRSGQIFGLLKEMRAQFGRDLGDSQKEELKALVAFQRLRAAKLSEIEAATKQLKSKETALADLMDKKAKADGDIEALKEAMSADQAFLENLTKNCKVVDEEYQQRLKERGMEMQALGEALKILTENDARDLFGKTMGFLQVEADTSRTAMREHAADRAMRMLVKVAQKSKNWALASLAVHVKLDAFTKVKKAMDKMAVEMQKQQKEEYEKWEFCKKSIDETEDSVKDADNEKNDLDEKHQDLTNTLETLRDSIDGFKTEVADMEVALKQAGESRKKENQLFQDSVADQRATVNILNKVLDRLKQFYAAKPPALLQRQEPGAAAPPPPPRPQGYEKSGSAGGVLQLIAKIIEDAEVVEQQLTQDEQKAQQMYGSFVKDTSNSIEANRDAIAEQEQQAATAEAEKSETEEAQLANGAKLEKLGGLLQAHHLECDFLIKYFDVRQKARAEELDAIGEAKAILSGADFGSL